MHWDLLRALKILVILIAIEILGVGVRVAEPPVEEKVIGITPLVHERLVEEAEDEGHPREGGECLGNAMERIVRVEEVEEEEILLPEVLYIIGTLHVMMRI